MQTLTIRAATRESAIGLYESLSGFRTELVETDDGRHYIEIELGRGDREIVDVLNAIEQYVTQRNTGPARIELNGRDYTLHGEPHADDRAAP
jgi:hypothetical protein